MKDYVNHCGLESALQDFSSSSMHPQSAEWNEEPLSACRITPGVKTCTAHIHNSDNIPLQTIFFFLFSNQRSVSNSPGSFRMLLNLITLLTSVQPSIDVSPWQQGIVGCAGVFCGLALACSRPRCQCLSVMCACGNMHQPIRGHPFSSRHLLLIHETTSDKFLSRCTLVFPIRGGL